MNRIVFRIAVSLFLGLGLAWGLSEIAFLMLKDSSDHEPQRIELVIPRGTAERIAAGQPVPAIPKMVFVVGDTLVVKNEDVVSHQLGPSWVPPGATVSLTMDRPNKHAYSCSFQPTRYLGLDVRSRVTTATRLTAILFSGPPLTVLLFLYGLVLRPLRSGAMDSPLALSHQP